MIFSRAFLIVLTLALAACEGGCTEKKNDNQIFLEGAQAALQKFNGKEVVIAHKIEGGNTLGVCLDNGGVIHTDVTGQGDSLVTERLGMLEKVACGDWAELRLAYDKVMNGDDAPRRRAAREALAQLKTAVQSSSE